MNATLHHTSRRSETGSVFILVLWIAFGLVVLSLYFANSMTFELRAADNRAAAIEAEHAVNGAARYTTYILTTLATNGAVPDTRYYVAETAPVGDATFWLIGRNESPTVTTPKTPVFGLVDESSKLNLNAAWVTADTLALLPGMTLEFAAAIIDWRDTDSDVTQNGAEDDTYARMNPPRKCKNGPFETIDELRLVYGATPELLYGEDANRNGVLDANENDGDTTPPSDNRDGRLDPGLLEYVTVYTREPSDTLTNVADATQLTAVVNALITDTTRARAITQRISTQAPRSVMDFYVNFGLTADEFTLLESSIHNTNSGQINVNTASEAVLYCVPGVSNNAANLVAYRQSNRDLGTSVAWVKDILGDTDAVRAGPYLTGRAYQFSADIAALGHYDRGYQRVRFVFDVTDGTPKILYRQDLTRLGWALGTEVRDNLQLAKNSRK